MGRGTAGRPGATNGLDGVVASDEAGAETGAATAGTRTASGGAVMVSTDTGGALGVTPAGSECELGGAAGVVGNGAAGVMDGGMLTRRALGGGGG